MADETPTTVEEVLPEEGGGTEFDTPTKLTTSLTGKLATQADVIPGVPPKLPTGTEAVSTAQAVK